MLGERFDQVIRGAAVGDEHAFAALWCDAQPMLLRYLRVLAGDLAEDVASETWLKVIDALGSFSGDEIGFRGWLVTVARHTFLDGRRRVKRRPEYQVADPVLVSQATGQAAPDAADVALDRLGTDAAVRLVASLPPDKAEMVMLRVMVGLDVAEVARLVGRTPGAVRVAVHRALRELGGQLTGATCNAAKGAGVPPAR